MKSIVALFFVFIFSASFITVSYVSNLEIMANYLMHRKEITAKFCVNKDKPSMHCDGKCYLRKQLKKEQQHDKKTENILQRLDVHLICEQISNFPFHFFSTDSVEFPPFRQQKTKGYCSAVFHPPLFSA